MSRHALHRDITREFLKSITRFLSILLMIALGSFIFVGLYVTGPTMRRTVLTFVESHRLQDLTVTTPFGLDSEDQILLENLDGVEILDYGYRADLMIQNTDTVVRLESLTQLPGYEIIEGRLPETETEIAMDADFAGKGYEIGDTIEFLLEQWNDVDLLLRFSFTISGFVQSPEYLSLDDKGTATIGNGKINYFGVIQPASFNLENVSLARLTFTDVSGMDTYSDLYKSRMQTHVADLDAVFASRPDIRLRRYQREGLADITSAEEDLTEAEQELANARQELIDARAELDQGLIDYEEGKATFAQKIQDAKNEIRDGEAELVDSKATLDDGWSKLIDGEQQLADAHKKYENGKEDMEDAEDQIRAGQAQLDAAQAEIDSQQSVLDQQKQEIETNLAAIDEGLRLAGLSTDNTAVELQLEQVNEQLMQLEQQIDLLALQVQLAADALTAAGVDPEGAQQLADNLNAEHSDLDDRALELQAILDSDTATLDEKQAAALELTEIGLRITQIETQLALITPYLQANGQLAALTQAKTDLETVRTLLENKSTLLTALDPLAAGQAQLDQAQTELDAQKAVFAEKTEDYEDGLEQLKDAKRKLDEGAAELAQSRKDLEEGQTEYEQGLLDLEEAKMTLAREQANGQQELEDAYQELLDGEQAYEEGLHDYYAQLPGAREDISQGEADISSAKRQLARLKVPDYTIQDRYKDPGFFQFIENSESMDFLSYVFPVFFFLIALLVSLTTMTRMVDEQRLQIGTLKALSYSNWDIVKKYLAYGSLPSLFGSLTGIVVGQKILMPAVFSAYASNFIFTKEIPDLPIQFSILAVLISLLCTGFVAVVTTYSSLKENVASLLRPKAPRAGTRIWLERLTPIWKRLSFHSKVTARNIFRFKKRMSMTILGVSGCAALIFMGFGIRDSIGSILPKQYGDLFRYDTIVIYDADADPVDLEAYATLLSQDDRIKETYPVRLEQGIITVPGKLDQTISLVVPQDAARFAEINKLRDRVSQKPLELGHGAVISEKLALLLGLQAGDQLDYEDQDGLLREIPIGGITENYTGHYLYLSASDYEWMFAKDFQANSDYILLKESNPTVAGEFSRDMLDQEIVLSTVNSHSTSDTVEKLTASMDIIVLVILLASSLLAIVVLYNLTNINVSERIRELSTIMVLGFYPKEVTTYVYRETMTLTGIGILLGFVFGRFLHYFVISSLAPSNVLLDPYVWWSTYALSALFTLVFSLIVMVIMHNRLMRIDMVGALKAVE